MIRTLVLLSAAAFGALRIFHFRRRGTGILSALGLSGNRRALGEAAIGVVIAASAIGSVFVAAATTGSTVVTRVGPATPLWDDLLSFAMVPFVEELVFRGALLGGLLVLMPRRTWAAIAISAGVFGGLHLLNAHATPLAALGSTLGGIAYGIAFGATQNIWLAYGLHFGWNYVQGPVLGFAVSGGKPLRGTFIGQESVGPDWFTGGEYGPEGGVLGLLGRAVVLLGVLVLLGLRRRDMTAKEEPATASSGADHSPT